MDDEMVGRSPALLALREIMYRSCELTVNKELTKDEAIEIYKHSLKIAIEPVLKEASNGQVNINENLTSAQSVSQNNQYISPSSGNNQNNSNSTNDSAKSGSSRSHSDSEDHSGHDHSGHDHSEYGPSDGDPADNDPSDDDPSSSDSDSSDSSDDDCKDGETYDDVMETCLPD